MGWSPCLAGDCARKKRNLEVVVTTRPHINLTCTVSPSPQHAGGSLGWYENLEKLVLL